MVGITRSKVIFFVAKAWGLDSFFSISQYWLDCFLGRNTLLGPPSTFHSCNWQNENMAKLSNLSGEFLQMNANEAYSIYRRMLNESMASPASLRCQAEALNRRALAGREAHLGANHPGTLNSMDSLALLLRQQGKLAQAGLRSLDGERWPSWRRFFRGIFFVWPRPEA